MAPAFSIDQSAVFLPASSQPISVDIPISAHPFLSQVVFGWLKNSANRLHKFYPVVSSFTYRQLMSVTDSNIDRLVQHVGNPEPELTTGGKKRLVKTITSLHRRQSVLVKCLKAVKTGEPLVVDKAITEVRTIIATPLLRVSERSPYLTGLIFTIFILAKEKMDMMPCLSQRVLREGNFAAIAKDIANNPSFNLDQRIVARNYLPAGDRAGKPSPVSELISVGTPIEPKKQQQQQHQQPSPLHNDLSSNLRRQDEEFLKGLPDLLKGLVRAKL